MLGKTLGRYEILAELGSGGMATVYRAKDRELGREVAIKLMHPHLAKKQEYAERFRREARAVAALRHPHIIEIHDFVTLEGEGAPITFMVSELVEGPALSRFLEEHPRMLPEAAALLGARIAEALSCAHEAGIIHRDVKPENVLIAQGGRPVLTDFGIARVLEGETVTATGALIGSPSYMSPEQAKGLRPVAASDLFSLGVVLYRAATGRLPFPGKDPLTVITAILKGDFRPAVQVAPGVGNRFDAILRRCLAPDATERFARAQDLASELLDFAAEGGLTDVDGELRRYFEAPEAFEAAVSPRVVTSLMERAERRAAEGGLAAALALCDRTLCMDPENPRARAMLSDLARRRAGRRWISVAAAAAVALVALFAGIWLVGARGGSRPAAPPALAQGDPGLGDAGAPGLGTGPPDSGPARSLDGGGGAKARADAAGLSGPAGPMVRPPGSQRRRPPLAQPGPDASVPARPGSLADAGPSSPPRAVGDAGPTRPALPAEGSLQVLVLPFCDVKVDGRPLGRSPMPTPMRISAGKHLVTCSHQPSGQVFQREVRIEPGRLLPLRGSVLAEALVTIRLTRGDRIRIGAVTYGAGQRSLTPGRYRYQLLRNEGAVQTGWVSIPPGRCSLTDHPTVECR